MLLRGILALLAAMSLAGPAGAGPEAPTSEARSFAYEQGIVDLLIIGPAAKTLYDRLPGRGAESACGGGGLHKGDGRITCLNEDEQYSCHVWLDVPRQTLTDAEIDDC